MPTGGGGGGSATKLTFWSSLTSGTSSRAFNTNQTNGSGITLTTTVTFSNISVHLWTADGTNLYDLGIYDSTGTLKADIGPSHLAGSNLVTFAVLQAPVTLVAGLYLFAWTGNAATAALGGNDTVPVWFDGGSLGVTSGGQLLSSISFPAKSVAYTSIVVGLS